jgi:hypothetical protein
LLVLLLAWGRVLLLVLRQVLLLVLGRQQRELVLLLGLRGPSASSKQSSIAQDRTECFKQQLCQHNWNAAAEQKAQSWARHAPCQHSVTVHET